MGLAITVVGAQRVCGLGSAYIGEWEENHTFKTWLNIGVYDYQQSLHKDKCAIFPQLHFSFIRAL